MKIGILSDTHGLLRPAVVDALQGCDRILHGGDIGSGEVLDRLREIAPVFAVRGNADKEWAEHLPPFLDTQIGGLRIYMTHKKKDLPENLRAYDVAVYGHSHQYAAGYAGATLLLNPGSCGPRRFRLPNTMAILHLDGGNITVQRVDISSAPAEPAPDDFRKQVETVIRETQKGRTIESIARKYGLNEALVGQIVRLYVTHPGVTADGILTKMGL
ncbi:MAG: YfcE family phosphodiesterase [Christensenellales bacterium]